VRKTAGGLMVDAARIDRKNSQNGRCGRHYHHGNDALQPESERREIDPSKRCDVAGVVPEFVARDLPGKAAFADKSERQPHESGADDRPDDCGCRLAAEDGGVTGACKRPESGSRHQQNRQDDQRPFAMRRVDPGTEEWRGDHAKHATDRGDEAKRHR